MVSKISICNLALAQLGQSSITSLTQEDERARKLNLFYEPVRDEVLRTHNWAFATVQEPLTLVEEDELRPGHFLYKYPTTALFIQRIFDIRAPQQALSFQERYDATSQERLLEAAASQAYACYTRRMTDETQFDPAFVKAFSLALACDLAITLTGDMALAAQLMSKYQLCLEEARRSNMTENFLTLPQQDTFSEAR